MLKIIDRYIIKKFLTTFFFMLGVIMILAMVFDMAEKLGEFIDYGASAYDIIVNYYVNFILFYANMFSSMIIFISVIWFTAKMAQETEIIPIWNSGRPFGRFVRPYMIAATILMIVSLIFNHFIIPRSNNTRLEFEERFYRLTLSVTDYHAEFPGHQVVYFNSYTAETNLVYDLTVEQWDDKNKLVSIIKAATAENKVGTNDWHLSNYYERIVGDTNDRVVAAAKKDTVFQFDISEIATRENIAEAMNYFELKEFIEREREKGSSMVPMYEVELYQRTSYPFATYVLTIMGIAVASRKKRGGIGINIAIGFGIIFIYIFAMKVTTVSAMNVGFPSYIAVWIPNILFGIVAWMLYRNAKR